MTTQQVQQQDRTVTITVTINELNTMVAGLDELPHKFSRGLIDKVSTQAREQLQPNTPEGELGSKVIQ